MPTEPAVPWFRRRRRGDRKLDTAELAMLTADQGWNNPAELAALPQHDPAEQELAQRLDALDHAVSSASRRLAELMNELDLDVAAGVLTGPAFLRAVTRLCTEAPAEAGRSHALLHIWVPDFGAITLCHGAAAGSVLLAHLAHLLQSLLRDDDVVGRPAEDELAAAIVNAGPEIGRKRLDVLTERVAAAHFVHGGAVIPFRLFGSVTALGPGMTVHDMLRQAAEQTRACRNTGNAAP